MEDFIQPMRFDRLDRLQSTQALLYITLKLFVGFPERIGGHSRNENLLVTNLSPGEEAGEQKIHPSMLVRASKRFDVLATDCQ
jgi:hypothetical protein